jgi:hypothetical protein
MPGLLQVDSIQTNAGSLGTPGNSTGATPQPGVIGEQVRSYMSTPLTGVTTGAYVNATSINLNKGVWDVTGIAVWNNDAGNIGAGVTVSLFSGNTTTDHAVGDNQMDMRTPSAQGGAGGVMQYRMLITSDNTTVYLKVIAAGATTQFNRARLSAVRVS